MLSMRFKSQPSMAWNKGKAHLKHHYGSEMLFNIDLKAILIAFAVSYGAVTLLLQNITFALLAALLPDTALYGFAPLFLLALFLLFTPVLSGYVVAKLARNRPQLHVLLSALLGAALYAIFSKSHPLVWASIPLVLTWLGLALLAWKNKRH
ncbi:MULTISPECIES: hypothetical protein [Comamonas]|jgi:hypothetical protein|uniref:Uncharacterized protein n=1 Tax=Comamonas squillarum TaxID=2977320 RepID=A0ABY6A1U7_9BURK|nr:MULTISPECIES: hypothetical protein [Comamonas]UXC18980.1 hypothetical protein N4T19_02310 [Comamonas sp. PR12]